MRVTSQQLAELIAELHGVNAGLADAARPLELGNLSDDQRQAVVANLSSGLARWDRVTRRIHGLLGMDGSSGGEKAPAEYVA